MGRNMTEFNFKNIHFWLLSFFGVLVILALTSQIKSAIYSDFILKYCLFFVILIGRKPVFKFFLFQMSPE